MSGRIRRDIPGLPAWVLVSDAVNGRVFFKQWTAIGPAGTTDEAEAATFPSEQAAMQSPAYSFPMSFYKPVRT